MNQERSRYPILRSLCFLQFRIETWSFHGMWRSHSMPGSVVLCKGRYYEAMAARCQRSHRFAAGAQNRMEPEKHRVLRRGTLFSGCPVYWKWTVIGPRLLLQCVRSEEEAMLKFLTCTCSLLPRGSADFRETCPFKAAKPELS